MCSKYVKILSLSLLALIFLFSITLSSCGGGGGGGGGSTPPLSDADAVSADSDNLAVIYASGDSAASVTQSVTLSASGSNGTTITWESDNTTVIAINGTVSRPAYNDGEDAAVTVTLTATITKNGESDTKTFTLTVKKISTSATLSGLTVSKGILQPDFNSSITTYLDAPVPFSDSSTPAYNDTQSASITATATNSNATITINSNSVTSGSTYTMNNLAVGGNTATIVVTAEDGVTTVTYTVTVYRAVPVFKTGQTTSYATGDDGDLEKGVSWPATRFTDSGNGTMTDNMTGLVWLKDVSTTTYTWADGITYCDGLTTGGTDWRMPNVRELRSLVHYGQSTPGTWLNNQGFVNVQSNYYWAGTISAQSSANSFGVSFNDGSASTVSNVGSRNVWSVCMESINLPVTGQSTEYVTGDDGTYHKGVSFPSIRFHDNGDGTITDNMTGLMWLKNANNAGATKTWSSALTYIAGLNSGTYSGNCGYTDWKLPTVNELETLLNYSQSAPYSWLNGQGFSNVQNNRYWSGTTYAPSTEYAWDILMGSGGNITGFNKTTGVYVWPVRGPVQ